MSYTRTSRMMKDPNAPVLFDGYAVNTIVFKYKAMIVCIALALFTMVYFLWEISDKLKRVELENFYLQDALSLKTEIYLKKDTAYQYWITHLDVRMRVKNELKIIEDEKNIHHNFKK